MFAGIQKGVFHAALLLAMVAPGMAQPSIVSPPEDRAAVAGAPVTFKVLAQGTGTLRYQWQFNGQDLPNARSRTLRLLATPTRAGTYSVRVFDAVGERSSEPARLDVVPRPRILQQPRNTVVGLHQTAVFETVLNDSGPYTRLIWHNYNPLEGSHQIPPGLGFEVDEPVLTIPNCLDTDSYNGTYWFAATNSAAGTKSRRAKLTVVGPPRFVRGPVSKTVRQGGRVALAVQVAPEPGPPETFQWYHEGEPIPGATTKRLVLTNLQPGDSGHYYCVATSIGGSAPSWGAQITVIAHTQPAP